MSMRTPATFGVTLLPTGLKADINYALAPGILPLVWRANYNIPRYVNRIPANQGVDVDQNIQLPYSACVNWTPVDVGLIARTERIMVSEPATQV